MSEGNGGKANGASAAERRSGARVPVEMWVEDVTNGDLVFRRAGNLSRGGLYLDQTIPMPVGSKVQLRFTLPGDASPVLVTGEIVSINAKATLGMGVKFVELDAEIQRRIDVYLAGSGTPATGVPVK